MDFHATEQALENTYSVLRYHSFEKLVIWFILTYSENLALLFGFPSNERKIQLSKLRGSFRTYTMYPQAKDKSHLTSLNDTHF